MANELISVGSADEIRDAVAKFNDIATSWNYARKLLRATTYWVYDQRDELFGPSKFVGFCGLDASSYDAAASGDSSGRQFSGGVTRFDLAWEHFSAIFVAEVKSITEANEEKQLRLGLGQILRYAHLLGDGSSVVIPVLVAERQPTDLAWVKLCESLGAMLVWPDTFGQLLRHPTASWRA